MPTDVNLSIGSVGNFVRIPNIVPKDGSLSLSLVGNTILSSKFGASLSIKLVSNDVGSFYIASAIGRQFEH